MSDLLAVIGSQLAVDGKALDSASAFRVANRIGTLCAREIALVNVMKKKSKSILSRDAGISAPEDLIQLLKADARSRNMTLSRLTRIVMAEFFDNPRFPSNQ